MSVEGWSSKIPDLDWKQICGFILNSTAVEDNFKWNSGKNCKYIIIIILLLRIIRSQLNVKKETDKINDKLRYRTEKLNVNWKIKICYQKWKWIIRK